MKTLLAITFLFSSCVAFSQGTSTKPTAEKPKAPEYQKVVKVPTAEFSALVESMNQWRQLVAYDVKITPEQRVAIYQQIDSFLATISRKIQIDSVRIESAELAKPTEKKKP